MKLGKESGFNLLELMIVVAIIGILVAIVLPNYNSYMQRAKRVDVQSHLQQLSVQLENYRLVNHSYNGATLASLGSGGTFPLSGTANYSLTLTDITGKAWSASGANVQSWLLVATPTTTGPQKGTGIVSLTSNRTQCWYKNNDTANVTATTDAQGQPVAATACPNQWEDR